MPQGPGTYGSTKGRPPAPPQNKVVAALANRGKKTPMPMSIKKA
jgi:hypothetical protein